MFRIEDISEDKLDDVFKICSGYRAFAQRDDPVLGEGVEFKRRLFLEMLGRYGPSQR